MTASIIYIATILLVNWGFSNHPGYEWAWVLIVGVVFVARDFAQRRIGHWVWVPMGIGIALSWWLADPFVALASATAFAISESIDWGVFTVTRRPLADRILLSSLISTPVDTAVFLGMIGILSPSLFVAGVASKMAAALIIWGGLHARHVYARSAS